MYVCVCRAVTDKDVKDAIEAGADTVEAVTAACCAGDDCGSCHDMIEGMIERRWGVRALPVAGSTGSTDEKRRCPNRAA